MAFEQAGRICRLLHDLEGVELHVRRLQGTESISRLFSFNLELISPAGDLDFTKIIGQTISVEIQVSDSEVRYITGIVSRFSQMGVLDDGIGYQLELVPWLWLLTRRKDCRIFQNTTVPDIIRQVFGNLKLNDFEMRFVGKYEPLLNCVQYRETDFDFVSRLLEEEGIHYFFEHAAGKLTMVMADSPIKNMPCPAQEAAEYITDTDGDDQSGQVKDWHVEQLLQPANYTEADFNFLDPSTKLVPTAPSTQTAGAGDSLEMFEYPGIFTNRGKETDPKMEKGDARIRLRVEEGDAQVLRATAATVCRAFLPGFRFDLTKHFRKIGRAHV